MGEKSGGTIKRIIRKRQGEMDPQVKEGALVYDEESQTTNNIERKKDREQRKKAKQKGKIATWF